MAAAGALTKIGAVTVPGAVLLHRGRSRLRQLFEDEFREVP